MLWCEYTAMLTSWKHVLSATTCAMQLIVFVHGDIGHCLLGEVSRSVQYVHSGTTALQDAKRIRRHSTTVLRLQTCCCSKTHSTCVCLQVSRSVEYVQSGTTALQDAKTLQKKTRKWMCCAIILLLVTAAVIVIVVSTSRHWAAIDSQTAPRGATCSGC
jgi:hypothetical protein